MEVDWGEFVTVWLELLRGLCIGGNPVSDSVFEVGGVFLDDKDEDDGDVICGNAAFCGLLEFFEAIAADGDANVKLGVDLGSDIGAGKLFGFNIGLVGALEAAIDAAGDALIGFLDELEVCPFELEVGGILGLLIPLLLLFEVGLSSFLLLTFG